MTHASMRNASRLVAITLTVLAIATPAVAVAPPSDFNWTLPAVGGTPIPNRCFGTTGLYDPLGDKLIVFGGHSCGSTLNSVWMLSNASGAATGSDVLPIGAPLPRSNHAAVYDAANDRMTIFGGCLGGCLPTLNDSYVLVNATGAGGTPTWAALGAGGSVPSPRQGARAFYDPTTNRMMMFGGQDGGGSPAALFFDVSVLTNANGLGGPAMWSQLATSGGPPPGAYYPVGHYNPTSNTLTVALGGNTSAVHTNAVWILSNANGLGGTPTWTNPIPEGTPGSPSIRMSSGYASDLANDRLMVFGGAGNSETWVLTNASGAGGPPAWTQLATSGAPGVGVQTMAYDPNTNQLMMFANNAGNTAVDFWRLSNANGLVPPPPNSDVKAQLRGRFKKTPINIKVKGRTPMTVFGSVSFNVTSINDSTVKFGANGTESSPVPGTTQDFDVNKDGKMDRIFQFQKSPTATPCGTTSVTIKGDLTPSGSFSGSDSVKVVPCPVPQG